MRQTNIWRERVIVCPKVSVTIDNSTLEEPTGNNTTSAVFTVTLNKPTTQTITVTWAISGTASDGSDYTNPGDTTVTFKKGEQTKTIVIPILPDANDDPDETITVTLTAAQNATLNTPYNVKPAQTITITAPTSHCPGNTAINTNNLCPT